MTNKELAIFKWQMIINNGGYPIKDTPPELQELKAQCSYCEQYYAVPICNSKCPMMINHTPCYYHPHIWNYWSDAIYSGDSVTALEYAKKILEHIKNIEE